MRYFLKNTKGLVVMETVIVMPLHLLLFLSVMWLGQLMLDRIRLAEADRVSAYTGSLSDFAKTGLFHEETAGMTLNQELAAVTESSGSPWQSTAQSRLKLTRELPTWLSGILYVCQTVFGDTESGIGNPGIMVSQGEAGSGTDAVPPTSFVYRRVPDVSSRNFMTDDDGIGRSSVNKDAVENVYGENYILSPVSNTFALSGTDLTSYVTELSLQDLSFYTRDPVLSEWSGGRE